MNTSKKFLNVPELAEYLGVGKSWIYDRTAAKSTADRIPHFKFGKYCKFDVHSEEFQQWLQKNFQN